MSSRSSTRSAARSTDGNNAASSSNNNESEEEGSERPTMRSTKQSLLRFDRSSVHSTTSSRARRKQRNWSIDHELHDIVLPPAFTTPEALAQRAQREQAHRDAQDIDFDTDDDSSASRSLNDSDFDSSDDSFCAASDGCAPDQEFMESILIDEHPERLNLFDYTKVKKKTANDTDSSDDDSNDDDDNDDHSPPSPRSPPRRPPSRMLTRSTEKMKGLSLAPGSPQTTSDTTIVTAASSATTTPTTNTLTDDDHNNAITTKSSSHNTSATTDPDDYDDYDEDSETSDVNIGPSSNKTSNGPDKPNPALLQSIGRNSSKKTSLRTLGGTFFSRSLREIGRSFRKSNPSAKAAGLAVDT